MVHSQRDEQMGSWYSSSRSTYRSQDWWECPLKGQRKFQSFSKGLLLLIGLGQRTRESGEPATYLSLPGIGPEHAKEGPAMIDEASRGY